MLKSVMTRLKQTSLCLLIGLFIFSPTAWSLPDDKNQPIHIKSDKAEIDDSKGISIYIGNVNLDQGTINLVADKVTIYSDENGISRITALGEPASFQQQQEENKPLMHAYGKTIDYFLSEERIELRKNAKLEQDQNIFTGESIDYDISQRKVNASGGTSNNSKDTSRVEMVIQPNKINSDKKQGEQN